jgi:hypothetical protein
MGPTIEPRRTGPQHGRVQVQGVMKNATTAAPLWQDFENPDLRMVFAENGSSDFREVYWRLTLAKA